MRLLSAFVAHEATTQFRATRFRVLSVAYVLLACAPAAAVASIASREDYVIGPASLAAALILFQPALTTLFAGILSVDAITREREENSFAVVSLAPISAAGYVLRRWLSIAIVAAPVTMVPQLAAAIFAVQSQRSVAGLAPFAWTWLLQVLPVLLIASAILLSLGTITGRTVLAILAFGALFTIGLGTVQDLLAYAHRKIDGPSGLFAIDEYTVSRLVWTIRGYWSLAIPSESGWPIEATFDTMLPNALIAVAVALMLLAITPAFLRRTKRDVRPWRISNTHPLRTFLKTLNRIREEYALDGGRQPADVAMMAIALLLAGGAITSLVARESRFIDLAAQRYAAEDSIEPRPMSSALVVRSARIEGNLGREIQTRAIYIIENRGTRAESHLAFELHPALTVKCNGCTRAWNRVGVTLDKPLAPGAARTIAFEVSGTPDAIDFAFTGRGEFKQLYNRYLRATTALELSDLSRSRIQPAATRDRMLLAASDFTPVPRYTKWEEREALLPPTKLELNLHSSLDAATSCGRGLNVRCTFPLATYTVAAARTRALPLSNDTTLLHLEPHTALARMHAPAITEALTMAERAWPGAIDAGGVVFERATEPGERMFYRDEDADIRSSGALHLVPEALFIRRKPMQPGVLAASMVASALASRRNVATNEQAFFSQLFVEVARTRLVREQRSASVSRDIRPDVEPLLTSGYSFAIQRQIRALFADLEYRVGADRVTQGIEDFLAMPGEGNGRQLIDAVAKRSGVNLDRFYNDYLAGNAIPVLTFENVQFSRSASGWEARGTLRNEGAGEVFCPIVLRTEHGSVRRVIRVDSNESIPFVIPAPHAPRALQLDPDRVCYRVSRIGLVENVEYRGGA